MKDNISLGKGTLYFQDENGEYKEIGKTIEDISAGVDYGKDEDVSVFEITDGTVTIDLKNVYITKFKRKKKGKRYLPYKIKKVSMFDDFIKTVFRGLK